MFTDHIKHLCACFKIHLPEGAVCIRFGAKSRKIKLERYEKKRNGADVLQFLRCMWKKSRKNMITIRNLSVFCFVGGNGFGSTFHYILLRPRPCFVKVNVNHAVLKLLYMLIISSCKMSFCEKTTLLCVAFQVLEWRSF